MVTMARCVHPAHAPRTRQTVQRMTSQLRRAPRNSLLHGFRPVSAKLPSLHRSLPGKSLLVCLCSSLSTPNTPRTNLLVVFSLDITWPTIYLDSRRERFAVSVSLPELLIQRTTATHHGE